MTEPLDRPSDPRQTPEGTPQYPNPYPSQYPPQPGPYPGGYPPPSPHYGAPPMQPRNGLGIASLVVAIIALIFFWSVAGGVILGLVAVGIGFAARGRVKRGEANNGGVAIGGIVLGALAIVVSLAALAVWMTLGMTFWKEVGGGDYISCMQNAGQDRVQQQHCEDQFRQNVQDRLSVTLTPTPTP
ncbi:MAG TPA: DUF4190 domain-containing protein [Mycobacterium sp.]